MKEKKVRTDKIREMKGERKKIVMVTAYDYPTGRIVDEAGVDIVLVGDSLGMTTLGYEDTLRVRLDEMIHHCSAVRRGVKNALLVGDMPFLSYKIDTKTALINCGRMLQEGGAEAVKLEGGAEIAHIIRDIVQAGIPVMGHIGLTPQSLHQLGGYKIQGKEPEELLKLLSDAEVLQEVGCFSIVIEAVPRDVGEKITRSVKIPTIGIGAGKGCDGQVLVFTDIVGLTFGKVPKLAKKYADLGAIAGEAIKKFASEVREGTFPDEEHSY